MTYTDRLVEFCKGWESFKPVASGDPLVPGVRDIGYGHVLHASEDYGRISLQEGEQLLREDLDQVAAGVSMLVNVSVAQHQFDALCSFALNVGTDIDDDNKAEGLGDSTLLKRVNACLYDAAAVQFLLWHKAGGQRRWGLAKRRFAEVMMFSHSDYSWRP